MGKPVDIFAGRARSHQPARPAAPPEPPGNALLEKFKQADLNKRQGPSIDPVHAAATAVHALLHGTASAEERKRIANQNVSGAPVFTGATAAIDALVHLPSQLHGARAAAVKISHPSKENPPSLGQNVQGLLSGALGIPRMGVNDKKTYPAGTLFHGSPEGQLGKIDALYHTKPWREGPGFFLTSNLAKAEKYAAGKTASAVRKTGAGAVNAFRLKPGANVVNLDVQPPEFWHGLAEKVAGPVDPAIYAQWAADIRPEDVKGASAGIVNRLRLMHFLTGYTDMPKTDAYYAIEDALHDSGIHATLHHEGGVPVHVVKDASVLERVQPTQPHPLLAARAPSLRTPLVPRARPTVATAKTLGETVVESLQGAKALRTGQEKLRSIERGSRAREYAKELQANPTLEGHLRAKQLLAGELPKLRFGGLEDFTPETVNTMVKHIADHPVLMPFEKTRTIDAIHKIKGGTVPTKGEERLLRQVFGANTTSQMMQSASKFHQLKALGYDVANLPRSVMASGDVSGILRQALLIATGHPGIWAKNLPSYFKALKSEQVYVSGMEALHSRPNSVNGVYDKMGIDLTELGDRSSAVAREESFRSSLAEKIPGVRMSGRGFTLFLDNARADLADHLYAKAQQQAGREIHRIRWSDGKGPRVVRERLDPNDPHLLESIGELVNSSSGRGDLGTGVIGKSQEGLNLLLFSPRLIKSRIDFINPFWYAKLDPLARHQAYKAMGGLVVMVGTALSIARSAGAEVNLDPRTSDFAKIKLGNTRVDLAGGFLQYMRILSTLATQQTVSADGKVTHLGQAGPGKTSDWDVVFRFVRNKLAPISSLAVDVGQRQNTVGRPLTWQNTVLSRFTPLSGQDAVGIGQEAGARYGTPAGVSAGVGAFLLSAVGGGVQNYTPKPAKPSKGGGVDIFSGGGSRPRGGGGGGIDIFGK